MTFLSLDQLWNLLTCISILIGGIAEVNDPFDGIDALVEGICPSLGIYVVLGEEVVVGADYCIRTTATALKPNRALRIGVVETGEVARLTGIN